MTYFYHFYDHLVNGHSFISVILTKWINARKILKVTSRPLRGGGFLGRYMVASLRSVARNSSSVVAVVGRGHLTGIANNWKEDIDVSFFFT